MRKIIISWKITNEYDYVIIIDGDGAAVYTKSAGFVEGLVVS